MTILVAGLASYVLLIGSMMVHAMYRRRWPGMAARRSMSASAEFATIRQELLMMRDVVKLATTRLNLVETELEELRARAVTATTNEAAVEPGSDEPDTVSSGEMNVGEMDQFEMDQDEMDQDEMDQFEMDRDVEEPARIVLFSPPAISEDDMTAPPDDLTRIWGIGTGNQQRLQENGVYYFRQIAQWTDADVMRFNALMRFKGRIEREGWISQAKILVHEADRHAA